MIIEKKSENMMGILQWTNPDHHSLLISHAPVDPWQQHEPCPSFDLLLEQMKA